MATNIGPRIGIEGEAEYRKQIEQITAKSKALAAELKSVASAFGKDAAAQDKARASAQVLEKQIENQRKAIKQYSELVARSAQVKGEDATETQKWTTLLHNAEAELNRMEAELAETVEQERRMESQTDQTAGSVDGLSGKMRQLGSEAAKNMKAAGEAVKGFGEKLQGIGKKLTTYVTAPILAAGTASVKFASDTEESANKVEVAFGDQAAAVMKWSESALKSYGMAKGSALDYAATFGDMGTSMGLTQKAAADMATSLTGLAGDLSSFKNIDLDRAMTALNGVFTGETESLKGLGIVMTQTNLEAFALAQGIQKPIKEMTEAEKVQLRYAYVMEATKNAQGDFARTSDGAANSMRTTKETIKEVSASIGEVLLPIVAKILGHINDLLQTFTDLDDGQKKTIVTVLAVAAAIGPLLQVVGTLTVAIGGMMILGPAIAGIAAPILAVIGVLGALVAAGVLVYKNWDAIKQFGIDCWTELTEIWGEVKQGAIDAWGNAKAKAEELKQNALASWEDLKSGTIGKFEAIRSAAVTKFESIRSTVVSKIQAAKDGVHSAIERIKSFFNFSWSLPKIKLPHFSISGSFSLNPPSVPRLSVDWYAKAMERGMILRNPTIFGAMGGKLLGGGERGAEAVVGVSSLDKMIRRSVQSAQPVRNFYFGDINIHGANKTTEQMAREFQLAVERRLSAFA